MRPRVVSVSLILSSRLFRQAIAEAAGAQTRSGGRNGRLVGVDDLRSRREPYVVMGRDIRQRAVQVLDAMRRADEIGMQRDAHRPAVPFTLGVERIERVADAPLEIGDADRR